MFRVGQKVVCVDDTGTDTIKKGSVYTIVALDCCDQCMAINVTGRSGCNKWFRPRFRPLTERKTDINIFREILRKATKQADTDIGASA